MLSASFLKYCFYFIQFVVNVEKFLKGQVAAFFEVGKPYTAETHMSQRISPENFRSLPIVVALL